MGVPLAPGALAPDAVLPLAAADGVRLRGAVWRGGDRGLALLLQGRTEFVEKAAIPAAALVARGFSVATLDWRGQGLSERPVTPPEKGHVGDFREYGHDLAALLDAPEVAALGPVRMTLAHSMGGTVALESIGPGIPARAPLVLSAPMLGIAMARPLQLATRVLARAARRIGCGEAWPPVWRPARPYVAAVEFGDNDLTGDRAVFDWLRTALAAEPRLALGTPTLGWLDAAGAAMARIARRGALAGPALCLLGDAERVVDPGAVRRGCARLGAACTEIAGGRHELLVEADPVRAEAWRQIDRFLAESGV